MSKKSTVEAKRESMDWISVLNEQAEWRNLGDVAGWFKKVIGRPVDLSQAAISEFDQSLSRIRAVVYALHFNHELDLEWLNAHLATIRFGLNLPGKKNRSDSLPAFRACAAGVDDSSLLLSIRDTLVYQCAQFIGDVISGTAGNHLNRCEGLYRERKSSDIDRGCSTNEELCWRKEIVVLVEENLEHESEIQRCADLFIGTTRSRFCSDACRFNTFQIGKQLKDPAYLAEKQRRYRKSRQS